MSDDSLKQITNKAGELPDHAVRQILGDTASNDSTITGTVWQRSGLTQAHYPKVGMSTASRFEEAN